MTRSDHYYIICAAMGLIDLKYNMSAVQGRFKHLSLPISEYTRFSSNVLGLGNISKQGEHIDALAAIFDLEGFTSFCDQTDPLLVVPEYLDQTLRWLFTEISGNFRKESDGNEVVLWGKFPFFAKFLGDGILFLWDTNGLGQASLGNIIINLYRICLAYTKDFLPGAAKQFSKVPSRLRCGIARGQIIAIGGGKDFVGPCMNEASRLQKVGQLSFAFARKGFDPEKCFSKKWQNEFILKKIVIRGLERDELVFVLKKEFEDLPDEQKNFFQEP